MTTQRRIREIIRNMLPLKGSLEVQTKRTYYLKSLYYYRLAIRVYRKIGNVAMVLSLEKIRVC